MKHLWQFLAIRHKTQRDGIHAMPRVFRCEPFSIEDMPQVAAAVPAKNLNAMPISIRMALYGIFNFIIKAGPAASGVELVFGAIEWRIAAPAEISASRLIVFIFSSEWHFCAFV